MPGKRLNDIGHRKRGLSLLALAVLIVACLYGGVLAWLSLTDSHMAGLPVARLTLPPEPVPAVPPADKLLRTSNEDDHAEVKTPPEQPSAPKPHEEAGATDKLTPDELALLDAARRVGADRSDNTIDSGDVKILGAETIPPADTAPQPVAALKPAPDPALIAQGRQGPLPIIAKDGRKASKVYARPLPADLAPGPHIALIVSGLGISDSATSHAIETLPPEVTLSFAPYGAGLQAWIGKARAAGHEVLLELPMEPFGYPQNDPGPYTLLTSLQPDENISRLEWLLSRFSGYVGVMNYQGARFTSSTTSLTPILGALKARGLMYVDNGASQRSLAPSIAADLGLPAITGTRTIDPVQNPEVIDQSLTALEAAAKKSGAALGVASGLPVTVDEVTRWAKTLKSKGIVLVPASATATPN